MTPPLRTLLAILIIALLQSSFCKGESVCYEYKCVDQDLSSLGGGGLLQAIPKKDYCATGNPPELEGNVCDLSSDGGCLSVTAIVTPTLMPLRINFETKNCTEKAILDCFEKAYGVQITEDKGSCQEFTQQVKNSGGEDAGKDQPPEMKEFEKCAKENNAAFPSLDVLGQLKGGGARSAEESNTNNSSAEGRQLPGGDFSQFVDTITFQFCVCRGHLCNDHDKLLTGSGKPPPPDATTAKPNGSSPESPGVPNGSSKNYAIIMTIFLYAFSATINY